MGILILRQILHPILGKFDIALILEKVDLGDTKANKNKEPLFTVIGRKEFGTMKDQFRIGKGIDAFTYTRDNSMMCFLQGTHRVFAYIKDKSYPIKLHPYDNLRSTTSKGMDLLIAQKLWGQGIAALRTAVKAEIGIVLLALVAGAGISAALFFGFHPGFVSAPPGPTQTSTGITGTLGVIRLV